MINFLNPNYQEEGMSIDNLVIEHLKALRAEVADIKADTATIRQRMQGVDTACMELRRSDLHLHEDLARQQMTMDQVLERVQRIEKRLELC
jgi:chromosome segregation ATPase